MRLDILVNFFLQLHSELSLFLQLLAESTVLSLEIVDLLLEILLIQVENTDLLVHLFFELFKLLLVLSAYLRYHHTIVGLAAVLEKDGEHLPHVRQQSVLVFGMRQARMDHFVEPD